MSTIIFKNHGSLATIELNRPERLNAINAQLLEEFEAALERANADASVRVIHLCASGRSFCAGDDLEELGAAGLGRDDIVAGIRRLQNITRLMMFGPKLVVCSVHGWAVGGGASWPLNADISFWRADAKIRLPEASFGLFPSGGMTWLLPQIAGTQRSMDLMLFGAPLEGADLVAAGIAPELIGLQSFSATVKQKIESLLALPAESLERYKRQRIALAGDDLNRALDLEEKVLVEVTTKLVLSQSTPSLIKS
jgi:enoyl-CoA hydratase/carnithine racemase